MSQKPFSKLPYWLKVCIRFLMLPIAAILHLIPHIIAFVTNLYKWVRYGGEFIVYDKDDAATIKDIYNQLKK